MSSALRKLRIIAVPLTRPNASGTLPHPKAKPRRLIYYQFQITVPKPQPRLVSGDHESEAASTNTKRKGWLPEEGIAKWVTNKATDIWAGFGKAKSGWKLKVYRAGERIVDRMEFEELALKSIDLSMTPSVVQFKNTKPLTVSLVFPPSVLSSSDVLSELRGFVEHRIPKHRKGFFLWMLIAPITAPLKLIPIIPNLPFFYCAWRSWSHYRAYRSSQYLRSLLDNDVIVPEGSESLDEVYKLHPSSDSDSVFGSHSTSPLLDKTPGREPQHKLLLGPEAVPAIISLFEFESTTGADIYRALEQARLRVPSGHADL